MKRKAISLLLATAMVGTVLAGCGSSEQETPKDTAQDATQESAQETKENAEATANETGEYPVIRMNYPVLGGNSDEAEIEEAINVIMREKAGAEIDLVGIEFGGMQTQMNLMLTGGDNALDVFSSFWYTSVSNLVANGQVIAIDDLIEADGQGILEAYAGFEDYLECAKINGSLYGIPCIYAWSSENEYIVRQDTSDAANINWDEVTNLDDLTDAMIKMKETSPDKYFIPGSTETYWTPKDIDSLGDSNLLGVLTDPVNSLTVENYYESDYFKSFLEKVKVWKENELISPDPLSNSNPSLVNLQFGVVDGTPGYSWDSKITIAENSGNYNIPFTGGALTKPLATTGDVCTYMWHISSFCKNPDAAMKVLNVLFTDADAMQLIANGIEGKEYIINENGQMEYPEGKGMTDLGWGASSMPFWPNVTLCKTWSFQPEDIYDQMKAKNESTDKSMALGFQFDASKVTDQMTACANVVSQYYIPLIYGEVDIDSTLEKFQADLKTAGIDDIIAEKQAQLDAWAK